jgi:hypothetical protein
MTVLFSGASPSILPGKFLIAIPSSTVHKLMSGSAFNDLWNNKPAEYDASWFKPFREGAHLQKFCKDWYALYDIHRIGGNNETLLKKYIPLNAEDISLQMRFSLRLSVTKHWKLKFPLAISPDLSTIVVLRTIITTDLSKERTSQLKYSPISQT